MKKSWMELKIHVDPTGSIREVTLTHQLLETLNFHVSSYSLHVILKLDGTSYSTRSFGVLEVENQLDKGTKTDHQQFLSGMRSALLEGH